MVFAANNGSTTTLHPGVPDIVGPAVVPTVNTTVGFTNVPQQFNVFFTYMIAKQVMTRPAVSVGDVGQPVSGGQFMGPSQDITFTPTLLIRMVPNTKMTSQSFPNFPIADGLGMQVAPGQVTVMNLKPI